MISPMKAQHDYWNTMIDAHIAKLGGGKANHAAMLTPEQVKKRREAQANREYKADTQESYE